MEDSKLASYIIGIDIGTGSVRAGLYDLHGASLCFSSYSLVTHTFSSGWAEQDPSEWWKGICVTIRQVLAESCVSAKQVVGIGVDATSCTLLALDKTFRPMRPAIMWCDVRASHQALKIERTEHPACNITLTEESVPNGC